MGQLEARLFKRVEVVLCNDVKTFPFVVYFLQFICLWGGFTFSIEAINDGTEYRGCWGSILLHLGAVTFLPQALHGIVKGFSSNAKFWLLRPFDMD